MTIISCDMDERFGIPNAAVIARAARKAVDPNLSAA
jgi:hypothetical protein